MSTNIVQRESVDHFTFGSKKSYITGSHIPTVFEKKHEEDENLL